MDYLTDILQDVVRDDSSTYSEQDLGQLNATYVQTNSANSPSLYATLKTAGAYLPVSAGHVILRLDHCICMCCFIFDIVCMYQLTQQQMPEPNGRVQCDIRQSLNCEHILQLRLVYAAADMLLFGVLFDVFHTGAK